MTTIVAPSISFVIYDRSTGDLVMAGVNKPPCVEAMCGEGQGILYEHAVMGVHRVDTTSTPPRVVEKDAPNG